MTLGQMMGSQILTRLGLFYIEQVLDGLVLLEVSFKTLSRYLVRQLFY